MMRHCHKHVYIIPRVWVVQAVYFMNQWHHQFRVSHLLIPARLTVTCEHEICSILFYDLYVHYWVKWSIFVVHNHLIPIYLVCDIFSVGVVMARFRVFFKLTALGLTVVFESNASFNAWTQLDLIRLFFTKLQHLTLFPCMNQLFWSSRS